MVSTMYFGLHGRGLLLQASVTLHMETWIERSVSPIPIPPITAKRQERPGGLSESVSDTVRVMKLGQALPLLQ